MKTFKQFLDESAFMFHGSPHAGLQTLKADRGEYMLDRAVGSHFAADHTIAHKFAADLYKKKRPGENTTPTVYRTKAPPRSQLHEVPQKHIRWKGGGGTIEGDQNAIASHISSTVFSQPENKHMFTSWAKNARGIDDATADRLHAHLTAGKAPADKSFGNAASKNSNSFHSYMSNFDSGLHMSPTNRQDDFRKEVVHKYLDIMDKKGIKGLVYKNTSPMETQGINPKGGSSGVRSRKSYIMFHPENHPLEQVAE